MINMRLGAALLAAALLSAIACAGNVNTVTVGSFSPSPIRIGQSHTATATATRNGNAAFTANWTVASALPAGVTVSFSPAQLSFTKNGSDSQSSTLTLTLANTVAPGNYSITIECHATSNSSDKAQYILNLSYAKANQTITFNSLANHVMFDAPFGISATASSGLPVSFAVTSGPATVSGSTVSITGVGNVTITASQAGNTFYNAATSVARTFTVSKASQSISFAAISGKRIFDPAFALSANATSGLGITYTVVSGPASISSGMLTPTGVGNVTVSAAQAGNSNYNAATTVNQTFAVDKALQTINFTAIGNHTIDDAPAPLIATASSGLTVTFALQSGSGSVAGNMLTFADPGSVTIAATQSGNSTYASTTTTQTITVSKANQVITFAPIPIQRYGGPPATLSASASSGLPVSFSIVNGPGTLSGENLVALGTGFVTIKATQNGNTRYDPATDVSQTVLISLKELAASEDTYLVDKNTTLIARTRGAASNDPDGSGAKVVSITHCTNGVVELESNGVITYTPRAGFVGTDTCIYLLERHLSRSRLIKITFVVREHTPPIKFIY